jgi:hypothetical protein
MRRTRAPQRPASFLLLDERLSRHDEPFMPIFRTLRRASPPTPKIASHFSYAVVGQNLSFLGIFSNFPVS